MGFGHVSRCLSLYQAFQEKGIEPQMLVKGDDSVSGLLAETSFRPLDWHNDKEGLAEALTGTDICIVDSYLAVPSVYREVSVLAKLPVYIDDNKRLDYPRGIVLNWALNAETLGYPERDGVTYLLGSNYASLRRSFWNVPVQESREEIKSVVVTFGGAEPDGFTCSILKLLAKEFPDVEKNVVIGAGFSDTAKINEAADSKTYLHFSPDANRMRDIIIGSDLALSSGGQTLFELARTGVPVIAISTADNQNENIRGWVDAGFVSYAGVVKDDGLHNKIISCMNYLKDVEERKKRSIIGRNLIDGLGSRKVAKEIFRRYFEENIIVRTVEPKDIQSIYNLSNNPFVRRNSFNQENIVYEDHGRWFIKKINDPEHIFLVAENDGRFLGQIRLDVADDQATVNISIVDSYRWLGVGRTLSHKAFSYLLQKNPVVRYIKAYVKKENESSLKFFEDLNFKLQRELLIKGQKALEYILVLNGDTGNGRTILNQ